MKLRRQIVRGDKSDRENDIITRGSGCSAALVRSCSHPSTDSIEFAPPVKERERMTVPIPLRRKKERYTNIKVTERMPTPSNAQHHVDRDINVAHCL